MIQGSRIGVFIAADHGHSPLTMTVPYRDFKTEVRSEPWLVYRYAPTQKRSNRKVWTDALFVLKGSHLSYAAEEGGARLSQRWHIFHINQVIL